MEFEELKIEVPMGDDESDDEKWPSIARTYENHGGTFVTGFDVNSQEAQQRRKKREKRFGFQVQDTEAEVEDGKQIEYFSPPEELPKITEGEVRMDSILLHGVDNMSTKDVFKYFQEFGPGSVEWIDDISCNVVWDDDYSASRALAAKGCLISTSESDDEKEDTSPKGVWRVGVKCNKAKCLLMRHTMKKDKKQPGAARRSMYYLEHGNPNNKSGKGKKKGIVSSSRKRKIMQERERARHIYSDEPEVEFVENMEVDAKPPSSHDEDSDEPPLKITVPNDAPRETGDRKHRMRMYADDESGEQSDVRSRVEAAVSAVSQEEEEAGRDREHTPPIVDLRSKLKNKQLFGFDYANRPSLSIEIKEEGS